VLKGNGENVKVLRELLRHSTAKMTLDADSQSAEAGGAEQNGRLDRTKTKLYRRCSASFWRSPGSSLIRFGVPDRASTLKHLGILRQVVCEASAGYERFSRKCGWGGRRIGRKRLLDPNGPRSIFLVAGKPFRRAAGTTGLEPAASAVTIGPGWVLQRLTNTRGLPNYP